MDYVIKFLEWLKLNLNSKKILNYLIKRCENSENPDKNFEKLWESINSKESKDLVYQAWENCVLKSLDKKLKQCSCSEEVSKLYKKSFVGSKYRDKILVFWHEFIDQEIEKCQSLKDFSALLEKAPAPKIKEKITQSLEKFITEKIKKCETARVLSDFYEEIRSTNLGGLNLTTKFLDELMTFLSSKLKRFTSHQEFGKFLGEKSGKDIIVNQVFQEWKIFIECEIKNG